MIEIYLVTSVAPVPMAAMMGKEWGGMGQNYLRSLLALRFQAFLIIVCVAIYAVLVQNIALEDVYKRQSVDDLFSTEESRADAQREKVVEIPLSELHPFKGHPLSLIHISFTLSDAMGKILMDQPIRPGEGILHHAEGVDLMPADIQPVSYTHLDVYKRQAVGEWMRRYKVPAYDEATGKGLVRHVYVRVKRKGESLCCVVINGRQAPREPELAAYVCATVPHTAGDVYKRQLWSCAAASSYFSTVFQSSSGSRSRSRRDRRAVRRETSRYSGEGR